MSEIQREHKITIPQDILRWINTNLVKFNLIIDENHVNVWRLVMIFLHSLFYMISPLKYDMQMKYNILKIIVKKCLFQ
jgi:hypothetical protein